MARTYPIQDMSDPASDPQPGEWHALRGELVALLDQVEGRYARVEQPEPALMGLTQRVRNLRDQVVGPEPAVRRREALRTVKRAVDRFSDRDAAHFDDRDEEDALSTAIAEIRGRQLSSGNAAPSPRRVGDMPEFRELNSLVSGLSGRLERLEGELKSQRSSNGSVREVASQVEQLTHVVELLAGAVGETGQVKRLESQIGALAALIEEGPKVDLSAINKRLDDVSATVGKLAELQAQQMEREIVREDRKVAEPPVEGPGVLVPSMTAIEMSVRNVYDRIDSIEKNVALSSGDFERLTSDMAAFTQAMKTRETAPNSLVAKVEALSAQIGGLDTSNGDVVGLKQDIVALHDAVMLGMEPRFNRIESQIEALSERLVAPASDTSQVESQLKLLMLRMDETGAQLNGLAKLYSAPADGTDIEAMATLVAERTSDAMTRKAPAPVAMFGPESLKSIEDRLSGLIKSAGKTPDYEALAAMVAEKTSEAVARSTPAPVANGVSQDSINAMEERVSALLNTAGKDTAARLARLEAALNNRTERPAPARAQAEPAQTELPEAIPAAEAPSEHRGQRLEAMLAALAGPASDVRSDAMPANPGDDAPLIDPGFKDTGPVRAALDARTASVRTPVLAEPTPVGRPIFDPSTVERPPEPRSSFANSSADPFAPAPPMTPQVEAPLNPNSTSTFVAAARRAQRARTETSAPPAAGNSVISRALSRFMPEKTADAAPAAEPLLEESKPAKPEKPAKAPKPVREKRAAKTVVAPTLATSAPALDLATDKPSFITRYRRPLLLAATLVAVSMLALNLVMQRMNPPVQPQPAPAAENTVETPSAEPAANQDVSLVRPQPRVIDMVDGTTTASINTQSASFSPPSAAITPMPTSLVAPSAIAPVNAPEAIGAVPATATIETFELPAEAVGPIELRQAAANGDPKAQFEIGAILTEGRAVEQNYPEAAIWYERSAAQGFVPAQYRLGNLYETGTGVEKDLEIAKLWYQRSAEAGNRMAMHNLAALYAGGQLGDQKFDTAAEWFSQAAARGMTDSQFNLGMLYARGLGVTQDFEQSYKWFSLAARGGDADSSKARDDIAKSLSAEAVSRVGAELAGWKAEPIDLAANFAPIGTWSAKFEPGAPITTKDVVAKVQLALVKLGYDIGTPDGLAGPKTAEAIKAFERSTGMSESGAINPRLLAVLGSQPV